MTTGRINQVARRSAGWGRGRRVGGPAPSGTRRRAPGRARSLRPSAFPRGRPRPTAPHPAPRSGKGRGGRGEPARLLSGRLPSTTSGRPPRPAVGGERGRFGSTAAGRARPRPGGNPSPSAAGAPSRRPAASARYGDGRECKRVSHWSAERSPSGSRRGVATLDSSSRLCARVPGSGWRRRRPTRSAGVAPSVRALSDREGGLRAPSIFESKGCRNRSVCSPGPSPTPVCTQTRRPDGSPQLPRPARERAPREPGGN